MLGQKHQRLRRLITTTTVHQYHDYRTVFGMLINKPGIPPKGGKKEKEKTDKNSSTHTFRKVSFFASLHAAGEKEKEKKSYNLQSLRQIVRKRGGGGEERKGDAPFKFIEPAVCALDIIPREKNDLCCMTS